MSAGMLYDCFLNGADYSVIIRVSLSVGSTESTHYDHNQVYSFAYGSNMKYLNLIRSGQKTEQSGPNHGSFLIRDNTSLYDPLNNEINL